MISIWYNFENFFLQTRSKSFKLSFMHDAEEFQTLQESCISWLSIMRRKDSFRSILRFESSAQISSFTQACLRKLFSWCRNSKICIWDKSRFWYLIVHMMSRYWLYWVLKFCNKVFIFSWKTCVIIFNWFSTFWFNSSAAIISDQCKFAIHVTNMIDFLKWRAMIMKFWYSCCIHLSFSM